MKAYQLHNWGGNLQLDEVEKPEPAVGEVLVAVKAVSINPIDLAMKAGYVFTEGLSLPVVLGCDVAGIVEAVGEGVHDFKPGDRVAGLINFPDKDGHRAGHAFAEYVTTPAEQVAIIPEKVDFMTAAALPAVALTAKQALFDYANIAAGHRILIHGAGGGVGHIAVQLAKAANAYVIATASKTHHELIRRLGADEVVDYKVERFEDVASDIDIAVNTTMDDTALRSVGVMKPGGTLITLLPVNDDVVQAASAKDISVNFMTVHSSGVDVAAMLQKVASGLLTPVIGAQYTFDKLPEALSRLEKGGTSGKIVVSL